MQQQTILITGAGGTVGSALAKRLHDQKLILLDNCEYNLYRVEREVPQSKCVLGDIRNMELLESLFSDYRPDVVYHAAAVKHVSIAEKNIAEAARVNIFGTKNVADCCLHYDAQIVVISTDKAVQPCSVMGKTKAIAEAYCLSLTGLCCAVARFVNVAFASGSVMPLFEKQIAEGGTVTVTDPEVTRYFVTLDKAVDFLLSVAGKDGIFALEGQHMKIVDLAYSMMQMANKTVPIEFIGLKPGERLHEIIDDKPNEINWEHFNNLSHNSLAYDSIATQKSIDAMLCQKS